MKLDVEIILDLVFLSLASAIPEPDYFAYFKVLKTQICKKNMQVMFC